MYACPRPRALLLAAAIALATAGGAGHAVSAQVSRADGVALAQALRAAASADWVAADRAARNAQDPVARDVVRWLRLTEGEGDWPEYAAFLNAHPDWPRRDAIRAHAERAMPVGLPAAQVQGFFAETQPLTGSGALKLAAAVEAQGDRDGAADVAVAAFTQADLGQSDLVAFQARYPEIVRTFATTRLDQMIWEGKFSQAQAVFPYAPADQVALARARIALRQDAGGTAGFLASVPPRLLDDPGLAHDRFQWRLRKDLWDDAEALLVKHSASPILLGRPDAWATRRLSVAHRAMRRGDDRRAYEIASQHHLASGSNYEELEWFAGWLALRKFGDADRALAHFERFRARVKTPISLGRAGYWLGRTQEVLGNRREAEAAYADAARYQTSFYGQLAAERIGAGADTALTGTGAADWRRAAFLDRPVGRAALLFHQAGDPARVVLFLNQVARTARDRADVAAAAQMAHDLDRTHVSVRVAKTAAAQGVVVMEPYYPVTELSTFQGAVVPELAMAIARQESEFNPEVVSPAGARGLMQLMPGTARLMARQLGLTYSAPRLTQDWKYNATLGQGYLAGLIDRFGGSYVLAAAGYNAGPNRVDEWIATFGDPRRGTDAMLDWIETIPFYETRNYVMRVMEALHVYRARLSGKAQPLRLTEDLSRRA